MRHWLLLLLVACTAPAQLDVLDLPDGYEIEEFAEVPGARSLAMSDAGILYVGTRGDKVYAVRDSEVLTIASGLFMPNGVAWKDGDLFVAEVNRILKYEDIDDHLDDPSFTVVGEYPSDRWHGWKYIAFGPDGLYVPVGAPCNVCEVEDPYGTITRLSMNGSYEVVVRGVRNSVGFDWKDGELWFTDNGRDWFGDDVPPDELNKVSRVGEHFGFPYCHGTLQDDSFTRSCDEFTDPQVELGPHVAALGVKWYDGGAFPEGFYIAEHGSWNRKVPIGYRITYSKNGSYEVFASGWLQDGQAWGRPVDVLFVNDSMLVSDDHAGRVYRVFQK